MSVLRGTGLGEPAGRRRPGGARARGPARVPQAAAMVCGQGARARVGPDRRGGASAGLPRGHALLPGARRATATASPTPTSCRPGWPAAPRPSGSPARRPAGSSPGSTALAAIACSTTAWPIPRSARPCSTRSPRSASCAAQSGEVRAIRTPQFGEARGPSGAPLEVIRGKAEQSNTAVMFDHRLILKAFRRVEPGINPDFEIGRFLGERTQLRPRPQGRRRAGVPPAPRRADLAGDPAGARPQPGQRLGARPARAEGLLRAGRATASRPAELAPDPRTSYLELADQEPPAAVRGLIGSYWKAATQLGRRTAELHRALASDPKDPAFAPEPLSRADLEDLRSQVDDEFDAALGTLRCASRQAARELRSSPPSRILQDADRLARAAPSAAGDQGQGGEDPRARRLPPRPGPPRRRRLHHPRLRGRARP